MTATESTAFLRRSLEDLDAELAAGDLAPDDYLRLRDQYVARLADALRVDGQTVGAAGSGERTAAAAAPPGDADVAVPFEAVPADAAVNDGAGNDGGRNGGAGNDGAANGAGSVDTAPVDTAPVDVERSPEGARDDSAAASAERPVHARPAARAGPGRWWRGAAWAVAVVVFAVAAGVLVARAAGTRTAGQSASGDIRATVRQQLDHCLQLSAQGQLLESIKCYDGVLTEQPSSAEANAYRGWTLTRVQDQRLWSAAQQNLDQAVLLDPSYADARVFRAVLERDQGRLDAARADLAAFDALDPPQMMRDLVDQLGLRASLQPGAGGSTPASGAPGGAAEPSAGSGSGSGAPATTATPPPATGG